MNGWIALYRSITTHWLYPVDRPFTKLEAWIDLLMMVNWTQKTVCFGSEMIECGRGEIITSQLKLMKRWGWSKAKLLNYQKILQKDRMIVVKSDSKKTTIKLLNYEEYQAVIENQENKKTGKKTAKRPQTEREKDFKLTTTEQGNNVTIEQNNNIPIKEVTGEINFPVIETPPEIKNKPLALLEQFQESYKLTGNEYEVLNYGKELAFMKKLETLYMKKYPDASDQDLIDGMKAYFDACVMIKDAWLKDNMSPAIIISKFNEINKILKNGNQRQNSKGGATDAEIAAVIAKHWAIQ